MDLPELLLEIQDRTGFASEFAHISEGRSRLDDLPTSICAVLLAEACNVGLTPLVRKGIPALERDRLLYVQQNYIRPDTLSRANARLVDYQAQIPLAQAWGGGEVASADGLRFIVPLRTLNAGPNPKYFGTGRGIYVTWNWGLWYHWNIKRTWRGHADIHRSRIHRVVPLSRAC